MVTVSQASQWRRRLECYLAGMISTAVAAPWIIIAVTFIMVMVLDAESNYNPVVLGVLGGLGGWGILALVGTQFVTIDRAYPAVYRQLYSRVQILQEQLATVEKLLQERKQQDQLAYAFAEVHKYLFLLQTVPSGSPQDWTAAFGYIRLWEQLHRAEEALILLAPVETVLSDAWNDKMRLEGSSIGNRQELIDCLEDSRERLRQTVPLETADNQPPHKLDQEQESVIRETLRYVRRAINEFRDERWFGLVQARNRLLKTVTLTGGICFALTVVAVMAGAAPLQLTAAAAFFLVGAMVGLFNQLRLNAEAETATEDYGLTTARLLHTPLFSGLAALGGILVMPLLSSLVNGPPPETSTTLVNTFQLTPSALILAVIFGLSPTAVLSRLQQEAERYKTDLRKSEAGTQAPVANADPLLPPPSG